MFFLGEGGIIHGRGGGNIFTSEVNNVLWDSIQ